MQKKKFISLIVAVTLFVLCLSSVTAQAGPLDWYAKQKSENTEIETDNTDKVVSDQQTETYDTPQVQLVLQEQQIISPAFGTSIGRAVVPEGWDMQVVDLMLGTETITWPNAVYITITSPDGECELSYISYREFREKYMNMLGYEYHSEDDNYDFSELMHYLNYRTANDACDLMVNILYQDNAELIQTMEFSEKEAEEIYNASKDFVQQMALLMEEVKSIGIDIGELTDAEATVAEKKYALSDGEALVKTSSCGYRLYKEETGLVSDTIIWGMPYVFAMKADSVDKYEELFDVFSAVTCVSEEYQQMCRLNGERLVTEYLQAMNGGIYTYNDYGSYDDIENDTIDTGDTYSAVEAWDDVIREENDYITGDGSHIKVSTSYDHVFEGEDGTIYAGNSLDGPAGSTELTPTQIGY